MSAVPPSVSREQLIHLLDLRHESETLDYKRECDLGDNATRTELAKDVAAMQVIGGHIVIGADDDGKPFRPGVTAEQVKWFDEARLRPILAKWLPEPLEIRTAIHAVADCTFALIHIAPNVHGFCVIRVDGTYPRAGRDHFVFRSGDVFARHGTSSERWRQSDIERIWRNVVAARKEAWRAELREDLAELGIARGAQRLIEGPAGNFTWRLDTAAFDAAALELFRRDDDIPLQRCLNEATADAARLIAARESDELATLVGRVTSIAAQAVSYHRPQWFDRALKALAKVYELGFAPSHGHPRSDGQGTEVWLLVLEHIIALGALAVRAEDWQAVRSITVQPPGADDYYTTWLRHGLTMAARANLLTGPDQHSKSLITMAAERAASLPALRPDISVDDEQLITSMCQFDILAALAIIDATGSIDDRGWYTNFARFFTSRTEPAITRLLTDPDMRAVLFPRPDDELAAALREIDRMASSEGARFNGWHGFGSGAVRTLLNENPQLSA